MKRFCYSIIVFFFVVTVVALAQEPTKRSESSHSEVAKSRKFGQNNADFEKFKAEKTAFFTKEAQLTPEEAGKVFPTYYEYQTKRFELSRSVRDAVRKKINKASNPSAEDYAWAAEELITLTEREASIDRDCYGKLKQILSAEKLFRFRLAEDRFIRHMIQRAGHRENRKSDNSKTK